MIFCTEEVRTQILADAQYAELSAVQNGRVYAIDPHYMEWQGNTVYNAAIDMMGLAYPELTESSEPSVTMELGTAEPSATPAPEYTALAQGDEGDAVLAMQERLAELGYLTEEYGGTYGETTAAAVSAFQAGNGLKETGEADVETLALLFSAEALNTEGEAVAPASSEPTPSPAPEGSDTESSAQDAETSSATDDAAPTGAAGDVGQVTTHDSE